jgi:3-dehydroquinate synthase
LAAATYLRGLPYMLVPTSLMAQVDAAIGGKVGADFMATKNWIGGFYHPVAVTMYAEHLSTLSDDEFSNGMAELLKVAAILGGRLWGDLASLSLQSLRNDPHKLTRLIQAGLTAKLQFLAADPFEVASLDRELNFGHCLGHAVEAASGFELRHGFAVAIGMVMALRVGQGRGITGNQLLTEMEQRLETYNLPTTLPAALLHTSWQGVSDLRKVRNGALRMALPIAPGKTVFLDDVTFPEFAKAANRV